MQQRSVRTLPLMFAAWLAACGAGGQNSADALCGNGRLDPGETCDDGNLVDGDNCSSHCNSELIGFRLATNRCPTLDQMTVLPSTATLGSLVSLSAHATDPDGDPIFYDYTGTGGFLQHTLHASDATFRCAFAGTHVITLWVFDTGGCVETSDTSVVCKPR